MYPFLCDMSLKDYKNKKVKANVWEKIAEEMRVSGFNFSGILTFSTSKNFAIMYSYVYIVEETN